PSPQGATVSLSETVQKWREYRHQCQRFLREAPSPATDLFCNRTFDDYACWPDGPPGSFVNVSCPWYLPWANSDLLLGILPAFPCGEGNFLHEDNGTAPAVCLWKGAGERRASREVARGARGLPEKQNLSIGLLVSPFVLLQYRGALATIYSLKISVQPHLHCTRNYIHLNLFASFILRALSVFVKDAALKWMYSTAAQQHEWDGLLSYQEGPGERQLLLSGQHMKALLPFWWLWATVHLVGLPTSRSCSHPRLSPAPCRCAWSGVPLLFVIPWGIVKYLYEDEGCWTRNSNMNYWLIIRLPILFAIGVNFLIFVRVICIVVSKLKANLMCKTDIKCRLAKSTLTLIPLLGTHEVIFAFVMDEHARGTLRFIKLLTELSFTSFQGLMVAILYCFVNNEKVQLEFRKRWERWRLERLHMQRDSSMKPLQCPTSSLSSGATVGSSVYSATCQASCS
uniref:Glucagon like peptide 1 receptor n=1 Tax=Myotis lucifugus TaxID=59463 RepID=G1PAK1_MYOLU